MALDVLLLDNDDWANTGYRIYRCIKGMGLNCLAFKGHPHVFKYPEQMLIHPGLNNIPSGQGGAILINDEDITNMMNVAKVVHFMHSNFFDTGIDFRKKRIVFQHGGALYRNNYKEINKIYNEYADATIVQMPDLMGLGAKNEHLIYFPVDTDFIEPIYEPLLKDKIIVGHWPSMWNQKGSNEIVDIIHRLHEDNEIKDRIVYIGPNSKEEQTLVIWYDQLDNYAKCDVVIDGCAPTACGHPYGEWGNTSFEIAAFGKIVITHSMQFNVYLKEYGECPMLIANSPEEVEQRLREVFSWDAETLLSRKQEIREWVVKKHSIPATTQRLWDKVYKEIL
jgi:hypothetical protein